MTTSIASGVTRRGSRNTLSVGGEHLRVAVEVEHLLGHEHEVARHAQAVLHRRAENAGDDVGVLDPADGAREHRLVGLAQIRRERVEVDLRSARAHRSPCLGELAEVARREGQQVVGDPRRARCRDGRRCRSRGSRCARRAAPSGCRRARRRGRSRGRSCTGTRRACRRGASPRRRARARGAPRRRRPGGRRSAPSRAARRGRERVRRPAARPPRPARARHDPVELVHVRGLADEVELLVERVARSRRRSRPGSRAPRAGWRRRGARRQRRISQVGGDDSPIPGRCTLMTTSAPSRSRAACTCAIDADASGALSTSEKTARKRLAELGADDALDRLEGEGAHAIEALAELLAVALGEESLGRRDELAELHVRRSELLEGAADDARRGPPAAAQSIPRHARHAPERDGGGARDAAHGRRPEGDGPGHDDPRGKPCGVVPAEQRRRGEDDTSARVGDRRSGADEASEAPLSREASALAGPERGAARQAACAPCDDYNTVTIGIFHESRCITQPSARASESGGVPRETSAGPRREDLHHERSTDSFSSSPLLSRPGAKGRRRRARRAPRDRGSASTPNR